MVIIGKLVKMNKLKRGVNNKNICFIGVFIEKPKYIKART